MNLSDRMKGYETSGQTRLLPNVPVIVRVDGSCFHSFTRGFHRPFDERIREGMLAVGRWFHKRAQGCLLTYHQSDELSALLVDFQRLESESWLGYRRDRIVSLSASAATAAFSEEVRADRIPHFDARVFNVPREDTANYFLWRARDWKRNSIQMFARSFFSHRQLEGKDTTAMHEMLHEKGENWAGLADHWKNGTFRIDEVERSDVVANWDSVGALVEGMLA